jgi:hypothetical protein
VGTIGGKIEARELQVGDIYTAGKGNKLVIERSRWGGKVYIKYAYEVVDSAGFISFHRQPIAPADIFAARKILWLVARRG